MDDLEIHQKIQLAAEARTAEYRGRVARTVAVNRMGMPRTMQTAELTREELVQAVEVLCGLYNQLADAVLEVR